MRTPHKHAEALRALADGYEIQGRTGGHDEWQDLYEPVFYLDWEYRIKPEREFPQSSLTEDDFMAIWEDDRSLRKIANAAIRHYIEETEK